MPAMFMKDAAHTGFYPSPPLIHQPSVAWKFKTGNKVISSPVISKNLIYIGSSDSILYALDAQTGSLRWKFPTKGELCSTPLIADGKVCFLSYDAFFYALDAENGKLLWKFATEGESRFKVKDYFKGNFEEDFWDFYLSSAVEEGGVLYFGSSDSHIYALELESGKLVWKYKTGGSVHSSPALGDGLLLAGSWDSRVYCLDALTGQEKWVFTTGRDTASYIHLGIQASPSIEKGFVYIGSRDGKLYGLELATGDSLWSNNSFDGSWMPSTAAIGLDFIASGSSDARNFYCFNKQNGEILLEVPTHSYTFSSPALTEKMAYIGSANGRLYGIDLEAGEAVWEFRTEGSLNDTSGFYDEEGMMNLERLMILAEGISTMPELTELYEYLFKSTGAILSSPLIHEKRIYFGSSDGYVYALADIHDEG